jgi:hypothetical protein
MGATLLAAAAAASCASRFASKLVKFRMVGSILGEIRTRLTALM